MKKDTKETQGMKPDKLCHVGSDHKTAKQASLPGQMYVPKSVSNESDFAKLTKNPKP